MQENITVLISGSTSPKSIQQSDTEQGYDFLQAQRVSEKMLPLGLISLSEFSKLTEINHKTFFPFWAKIMPKIP